MESSNKREYFKIETLTPVHIGTGHEWMFNNEYFIDNDKVIVLDTKKILEAIGEKEIYSWIAAISNGNTSILDKLPSLKRHYSNDPKSIAEIILPYIGKIIPQKPIKQQMHTGNGIPIIPGSSLKGSIRTAIFSQAVNGRYFNVNSDNINTHRFESVTNSLFQKGDSITTNIMRLFHVGDCIFSDTKVDASRSINNIKQSHDFPNLKPPQIDTNYDSLLECIPSGSIGIGSFLVNKMGYDISKKSGNSYINDGILQMFSLAVFDIKKMFSLINSYTSRIVKQEIKRGENLSESEEWSNYLKHLKSILLQIGNSDNNSCILPVGWGVGFRFITGDWLEPWASQNDAKNKFNEVANYVTKKGGQSRYEADFALTKTRRITGSSHQPWGFVKLTLCDIAEAARITKTIETSIFDRGNKIQEVRPAEIEIVQEVFLGILSNGVLLDFKVTKDDGKWKEGVVLVGNPVEVFELSVRYPSANVGDIIVVKVSDIRHGKISSISAVRLKN